MCDSTVSVYFTVIDIFETNIQAHFTPREIFLNYPICNGLKRRAEKKEKKKKRKMD